MRTIELDDIVHRYGDVTALDGLNLRIEAGESVVVLGPSGCGKSTLLRLVAGLESPTRGDIRFDGESQLHRHSHERDIAIVFQSYALYPHLTARGNITLGLRHGLKLPTKESDRRVAEEGERLGITELLDRKPAAMSGGQRQRVALARALAKRSGILLLDEPLSGLDAQLRTALRLEIASLVRSVGTTTLHVTHDQVDALTMADRVVLLRDGRTQQIGTPLELYRAPQSWFVAGFVGTPAMNGLPCHMQDGHVVASGDRVVVRHSGPPPAVAATVPLRARSDAFHLFAADGHRIGHPTPAPAPRADGGR